VTRQIVTELVGDASRFNRAVDDASTKSTTLTGRLQGIGKGMVIGAGIGVFNLLAGAVDSAVGALGDARDAFLEDEASAARLAQALQNNIPNWDGNAAGAERFASAQQRLGFADDDVRESLGQLVGVTHDLGEAQRLSSLAMDLARAKNIDLATATDVVTKAQQGNGRALKSLGIDVRGVSDAAGFLDAIQKNVRGSAETWAATNEGKLAVSNVKVGEAMEKVGAIVTQIASVAVPLLADALTGAADFLGQLWAAAQPVVSMLAAQLGPVIRQVATFIGGTLVPAISAAARTAFPIAAAAVRVIVDVLGFLARAISPVVSALASVLLPAFRAVAGFVTGTIVPVVSNVARAVFPALEQAARVLGPIVQVIFAGIAANIRTAANVVGTAITVAGNIIGTVAGAIGTAIRTAGSVISTVANAIGGIFRGISTAANTLWTNIRSAFNGIVSFVGGIPGRIASIARGMWDSIWQGFRNIINSIIRGWNSISFTVPRIDLPGGISVGGFTVGTPNIPLLHTGGIVPGVPGQTVLAALQAGEEVRSRVNRGGGEIHVHLEGAMIYGGPAGLDELAQMLAARLRLQGVTR